jgi:hypothetical protein
LSFLVAIQASGQTAVLGAVKVRNIAIANRRASLT